MNSKINLVNASIETGLDRVNEKLTAALRQTKDETQEFSRQLTMEKLTQSQIELTKHGDDRQKAILKMLRQETKDKVEEAIREKLQTPGLIGDG